MERRAAHFVFRIHVGFGRDQGGGGIILSQNRGAMQGSQAGRVLGLRQFRLVFEQRVELLGLTGPCRGVNFIGGGERPDGAEEKYQNPSHSITVGEYSAQSEK